MKNAVINGAFDIWQRGTSFAAAADGYQADRFRYDTAGTMVYTISRSATVPTQAQANYLANYSLKLDCTTADASIAAGDYCLVSQIIEGYNWKAFAQKQLTLSFWVRATKTGTYCVALRNSGADRSYVAEYTVNVTDTWEKKTVNIAASPSAGTWNYTNGKGVSVYFTIACGSTFQTTANAWQTGNYFATSNQVNGTDSTANDFYLALVQLELGGIATDFEPRAFGQELALCQRYYEKSYHYTDAPGTATTNGWNEFVAGANLAQFIAFMASYRVSKRANPTVSYWDGAGNASKITEINSVAAQTNNVAPAYGPINAADSQFVFGHNLPSTRAGMAFHWVADAEL
jgi:hypothetical protein